ncbi:MAG: hypothetical protein AB203_02250 [Parcubacteria bacterium C7867-008]|nr:MAG: hypothetical protein AB203_02250 [Parcubacteria bacterium C7867-008]
MADTVIDFVARILRPLLVGPARFLANPKRTKTWQVEAAFVAAVLLVVSALTTPPIPSTFSDLEAIKAFLIIWLSAAAVFGSFLHAQVGTYMAEDMSSTEKPLTECYHKLGQYWVYKELFWFLVFLLSGAYPAIAGNVIFLVYPAWRKIYKSFR